MSFNRSRSILRAGVFSAFIGAAGISSVAVVIAQDTGSGAQQDSAASQNRRAVSNGVRAKVKGTVVRRDADTFTVRDESGADTIVLLTNNTRVSEKKSNPFRRAKNYATTSILRGLNVEVDGRGDGQGQLVAQTVKFSDSELRTARSIDASVAPVENRVGQVEQNAERLSGQLDELAAISNAARGGAAAAQATADEAVAGVRSTNERISALDDYEPQQTVAVNFRVSSAALTPDSKSQVDQIARAAQSTRGYIIEIQGYADATGSAEANRRLSQRRADSVVRYLAETHNIPLRRIITPYGYGEAQPVADNTSREGRAQNRRVEVKLMVNRGLSQHAPQMNPPNDSNTTSTPQQ